MADGELIAEARPPWRRGRLCAAVAVGAVTLAAAGLRLIDLGNRPMHQDEAIHVFKCKELAESGRYVYDPADFHGPTLYYATLPGYWWGGAGPSPAPPLAERERGEDPLRPDIARWESGLRFAGTTEATYRVVPAVFGVGLVLLVLLLADGLGRAAALAAAGLTAVSPAMVFYSRYYIQEMLLVFFTFAALAAGWRYVRSWRLAWVVPCGLALGLMHATKETAVIAWAAMGLGLAATGLWGRRVIGPTIQVRRLLTPRAAVIGLLAAAAVSVAFFSAFFTHWQGPLDSLRTYASYAQRAGGAGLHDKPWDYYLQTLLYSGPRVGCNVWPGILLGSVAGEPAFSEALVLALAAVGLLAGLFGRGLGGGSVPLVRFIGCYTLAMLAAYAAIPYKTPWCMLGLLHGAILLAGVGAAVLVRLVPTRPLKAVGCTLLALGAAQLGYQACRAAFVFPADNRNPYVYAQVTGGVVDLARQVERLAAAHPDGPDMLVKVIGIEDDFWPLLWYLRRHNTDHVGHWPDVPDNVDAPVIIAPPDIELTGVTDLYGFPADYEFELRPTVRVWLCVQGTLLQEYDRRYGADLSPGDRP